MRNAPETDRHWDAFRYISGELTEQESLDFETRLLDDQLLREAVAEMVELRGAIVLLGADHRESPKANIAPSRLRTNWRVGIAVAVCLCLLASVVLPHFPHNESLPLDESGLDNHASLVAVVESWSALQESQRQNPEHLFAPMDDYASELVEMGSEELDPAVSNNESLPAWLLAAAEMDVHAEERQN